MFQKLLGLSLVAAVSAHQNFHQFWVNDVTPGYQAGIRMPPSNSPVTDVTSDDISCNVNGNDVPSAVDTIAANEGDKITVNWDISSHPGPITHFLFGPVDDAAQATGIGAGWFKIDERDYVDGAWANEYLSDNGYVPLPYSEDMIMFHILSPRSAIANFNSSTAATTPSLCLLACRVVNTL
jgi:cellulase